MLDLIYLGGVLSKAVEPRFFLLIRALEVGSEPKLLQNGKRQFFFVGLLYLTG